MRAEDFVVGLAGAEEREVVDAADFVEAHDAAKTGLGEQRVGVGELDVGGGEEDDAAAVGRLDALDRDLRAVLAGRICRGERLLERGERNHFAARLEEALEASREMDEAVRVDAGEIAGDVPALAVVLVKGAGAVVVKVAGENGRAVDEEQAALTRGQRLHRVGIDDEHLDAVERLADGAGTQVAGTADRDDGRAFGDAVALGENGVRRHLLRAGEERRRDISPRR